MFTSVKALFFIFSLIFVSSVAHAQRLSKVEIRGNVRIEQASILDKINLRKGSSFTKAKVTKDVRSLFKTGFFYDIKVDLTGSVLTYTVVEKPVIQKVEYIGNRAFDDDELTELTAINSNELLDIKKVNFAITDIKKKYEEKGFFLAKVNYSIKKGKKEADALIFNISEGDKVKIKKVNLIGNKSLSDQKLKGLMATREKGLFGMSGSFQKETLRRDREILGYIYRNAGYAQVKVSPANVSLTRDKRGMTITYYIEEGFKYKISDVSFAGDVDFPTEELLKETRIDEQKYFSQAVLLSDITKLQAKYGDKGYAYTNVVPRPEISDEAKTVGIVFEIKKGEKITIGEINVIGNTNTRDKVVRRELRLFEGELYNETEKRKSLANVRRLGFFDNVEFQNKVSLEGSDVMDLDINVKERSTGQLNIGAGYGGFQGFTLQGSIQQANFLGRGINFGLNINYSEKREQLFNLSLTDPHFRDTDYSLGFDGFRALRQVIDYSDTKTGGGITFGRRYNDFLRAAIKYKIQDIDVDVNDSAPQDTGSGIGDELYSPRRVKLAEGVSSGLTVSISYDRRNDRQFPTNGYYARASVEQTGIGGDLNFTKASFNMRYYKPLFGSLVWRNNLNYGWVGSTRDEVPFNELYRIGGPNTVRGYDFFSIAETKFSNEILQGINGTPGVSQEQANVAFGGKQQFYYNLEFEWALVKEAGIKGVVFFDVGMAHDDFQFSQFKSSYGFGFRWNSPLGPLRFEWGFPIDPNLEIGEKKQDFQFSIMQSF